VDQPAERAPTVAPLLDPPTGPLDAALEAIRLQAEEHPLIDETPAVSALDHCGRLMHLKAYDEAVAMAAGRDILDVGCNVGYGTRRFLAAAGRVAGVDVSPRAIEAATATAVDGRPEFLTIDGLSLPFPDASFDLVVSFQVIEHVLDPLPFLDEIIRISRPGGAVILTTPNAATRLYPGMAPWNRFHVREYRASELAELLRSRFAQVQVLGMFGAPALYRTEIDRVDAARRRVRRAEREAGVVAVRAPERQRTPFVRVARALLPAGARSWLRSMARGQRPSPSPRTASGASAAVAPASGPAEEPMDLATFLTFTTDDLWYADTDVDTSMDLMAVCRLE
jgi:SAM-dependent methyltransferase